MLGEPAGADCPVCRVALQTALIDGEAVSYCGRCRGFLTKVGVFGQIVTKRRSRHGANEQRPEPFDPAELKRLLHCPGCRQRMEAHPYFGGGNAVVDTCERCHLIWQDAGELAVIEHYIPHVHHDPSGARPALKLVAEERRAPFVSGGGWRLGWEGQRPPLRHPAIILDLRVGTCARAPAVVS